MVWLVTIVFAVAAWPTLRRWSTVAPILVYGFLVFGVLAALLYRPTPSVLQGPNIGVTADTPASYLAVFLVASMATWLGCILVRMFSPGRSEPLSSIKIDLPPAAFLVAPVLLLLYVYGTGLGTVFHATAYLEHTGPPAAARLASGLGPVGVVLCGYYFVDRRLSVPFRIMSGLCGLCFELFYFATDTRFFAFWPILICAGGFLLGAWSRTKQRVAWGVAIFLGIVALQIPLALRGLPDHGLVASFNYLFHQSSLVFGASDPFQNILYGAPLTIYVGRDIGHLPLHELVTSLNPLPSGSAGFTSIAQTLKVNAYTPYSAIGELLNHGWPVFVVLLAVFGAAITGLERLAQRGSGVPGELGRLTAIALSALFVLESTEYQLRTVARIVYYGYAAVLLLLYVVPRLSELVTRKKSPDPSRGDSPSGLPTARSSIEGPRLESRAK